MINASDSESPISAVSWTAILAGAAAAAATTLVLSALGSGLGWAALAPWPYGRANVTTITALAGIWLVITQWIAAGLGGYLTGRLRTRWARVHDHEIFFRDTAHGFLTWSVATLANMLILSTMVGLAGVGGVAPDERTVSAGAFFAALSMLIGAFIACVAAALGGRLRDESEHAL